MHRKCYDFESEYTFNRSLMWNNSTIIELSYVIRNDRRLINNQPIYTYISVTAAVAVAVVIVVVDAVIGVVVVLQPSRMTICIIDANNHFFFLLPTPTKLFYITSTHKHCCILYDSSVCGVCVLFVSIFRYSVCNRHQYTRFCHSAK